MRRVMRRTREPAAWQRQWGKLLGSWLGVASLGAAMLVADPPASINAAARAHQTRSAEQKGTVGWDTFRKMDGMAQLRGAEQSKQFSSFDRSGGNNDGFQGTYSCLRTSNQGCVIAEQKGAGEVTSIWSTREPYGDVSGTGRIIIELDGRTVLNAPFSDVVNGKLGAPFVWPLVSNADDHSGGVAIKVPMPYRESMRVTVQNNPYFYHVSYRAFPDADGVKTFDPGDPATDVIDRLRRFGVADPKPPADDPDVKRQDFDVPPGRTAQVAQLNGPRQINQLRLRFPQVKPNPQVVDDGRAFGAGGGSDFTANIDSDSTAVRVTRRFDPRVANQVAGLYVDGRPAGQWRSGAAAPGQWADQTIEVPGSLIRGKSTVHLSNQFVSSPVDVNEFRYDVQSLVNGQWVRTDALDLGPSHPGEEHAHNYRINKQTFSREKLEARYPTPAADVAASEQALASTRLRITFDGKTTVDAPIGEFFGSSLGKYDVRSTMLSVDASSPDGWYTSWWPMPFARNATVEVVNGGGVPIRGATAEITSASTGGMDAGDTYFHATHHEGPTAQNKDFNFVTAQGSGTLYGVTQTMRGSAPRPTTGQTEQPRSRVGAEANERLYLEGDERFYTDGTSSPGWYGTGTEDFYEGGWYFRDGTTFSMPLSGNPSHQNHADGCQYDCTGAFRLMAPDAVPFSDGLVAGIQHGPANDVPAYYSSTAYWYGDAPAAQHATDQVDLTQRSSRDSHQYQARGETTQQLNSRFEGAEQRAPFTRDTTRTTGPMSFRISFDQNNSGVRLRRLSDQQQAYQQVEVRIDGKSAGVWMQPLGNAYFRWLEDNFDIPPALTAGKSSAQVELIPVSGAPAWSASRYQVFSR